MPMVATWNMQGGTTSRESKWTDHVAFLSKECCVVALQEAGSPPDSSECVGKTERRTGNRGTIDISHFEWNIGTSTREVGRHIYHMVTDAEGGRVNLAMVTSEPAGSVYLARAAHEWSRPAFGLIYDSVAFWTLHANSQNHGGDAPHLLEAIRLQTQVTPWAALGDYNREPADLRAAIDRQLPRIAQGLSVCGSGRVTRPTSHVELDYMVTCGLSNASTDRILDANWSDHNPVIFSIPRC